MTTHHPPSSDLAVVYVAGEQTDEVVKRGFTCIG